MNDTEKLQALKAIQFTLERNTPPETLYVEPRIGNGWLYVDGTWIEADMDTHSLFLVPWSKAGERKWGPFGTRRSLEEAVVTREQCEAILEHVRAHA
ncbi:hypothetical protein ABZ799_01110 [Nocardiopsis dassonvillei]|uniref:hypothetical protein n=1 Tax=Nocardiopsis dassonvillei TaxID=2014 RepID=UPI003405E19F